VIAAAASTPDWIAALSTLVIGLLGILFGVVQFRASGFRPRVEALLAIQGDSIRITVANGGRAEGTIHGLDILDANDERISLSGAGSTFKPFKLSGGSAQELVFNAPEGRDFSPDDTVVVAWGKGKKRKHPLPTQVSFYDANTAPGARVP
jgi:hypothetical protein